MIRLMIPVIAACALVAAIMFGIVTAVFIGKSQKSTGTVVAVAEKTSDEGQALFQPTVEFMVCEERITFTPKAFVSPSPGSIGDRVPVLFDPRDPRRACIDSFVYTWLVPSILLVLALIFGLAHFTLNFALRRLKPRQ